MIDLPLVKMPEHPVKRSKAAPVMAARQMKIRNMRYSYGIMNHAIRIAVLKTKRVN